MIKPILVVLVMCLIVRSGFAEPKKNAEDFTQYANPFVGAAEFGHCFPGACVPFGLIQAGPETGNGDWDYCSGYQ